MLPNSIALSPSAAAATRRFVEQGGTVIADSMPGAFDLHSRRLPAPLLLDLFDDTPGDRRVGEGHAVRLSGTPGSQSLDAFAPIVARAGVVPRIAVRPAISEAEVSVFHHGAATVIALQSPAPPAPDAQPREVEVVLPAPLHLYDRVYDRGTGQGLGHRDRVTVQLDPIVPTVLVASSAPLAPPRVDTAQRLRQGETGVIRFAAAGRVVQVEVRDPAGILMKHYGGTQRLSSGAAMRELPLALNDPPGAWTVLVTDLLSGQSARAEVAVVKP
jgi:hypothetical protein